MDTNEVHKESFVADLHADTLLWDMLRYDMRKKHTQKLPLSPLLNHVDIPRLQEGGVNLQGFGIVTNYWMFKRRSAMIKAKTLHKVIASDDRIEWALSGSQAQEVWKQGKIGAFLGMEGAHPLEGKLENVDWFYDHGVRYIGLTHFNNTEAAYSSSKKSDIDKPLTSFGKELIHYMNEKKIIVDLAHINHRGFFEAAKLSKEPVIVSHTGIQSVYYSRRNINDYHVKAVAETGGVIGIMFYPTFITGKPWGSVEHIVDHMDAVKGLVGIEHVALGSDFDGFITLPKEMRDVSALPELTNAMAKRGYSSSDIKKVLGENFLRVYKQVCG